jgi:hypothetical protein
MLGVARAVALLESRPDKMAGLGVDDELQPADIASIKAGRLERLVLVRDRRGTDRAFPQHWNYQAVQAVRRSEARHLPPDAFGTATSARERVIEEHGSCARGPLAGERTGARPRCYPAVMEAIGPLLLVFSVPLMLRWVPRNRFYGFRVPATCASESVWYDANALCGRHTFLLGLGMVLLEFVVPRAALVPVLRTIGIVGLVAIVAADWRTANRWRRERESHLNR